MTAVTIFFSSRAAVETANEPSRPPGAPEHGRERRRRPRRPPRAHPHASRPSATLPGPAGGHPPAGSFRFPPRRTGTSPRILAPSPHCVAVSHGRAEESSANASSIPSAYPPTLCSTRSSSRGANLMGLTTSAAKHGWTRPRATIRGRRVVAGKLARIAWTELEPDFGITGIVLDIAPGKARLRTVCGRLFVTCRIARREKKEAMNEPNSTRPRI
jgi:hypothetical protein